MLIKQLPTISSLAKLFAAASLVCAWIFFTPAVLAADINVVYPNGGEKFSPGDTVTIRWSMVHDFDSVKLHFEHTNPQTGNTSYNQITYTDIVPSPGQRDGSYSWRILDRPNDLGLYRIRVEGRYVGDNGTYYSPEDRSDAQFTVEDNATLKLIAPVGGEKWEAGKEYRIEWAFLPARLGYGVSINLVQQGKVVDTIGNISGTYVTYKIPDTIPSADDYTIKIEALSWIYGTVPAATSGPITITTTYQAPSIGNAQ